LRPVDIFTRDEIRQLSRRSNWQGAGLLIHCWFSIIATWTICVLYPHPLLVFAGILIVGARQLGFGVINHEVAHYLLFENRRLNDWAAEWLTARPLFGASVVGYRRTHPLHHRHTQQPGDPDLPLSAPFRRRAPACAGSLCGI
jgi:fatty acid desaturase